MSAVHERGCFCGACLGAFFGTAAEKPLKMSGYRAPMSRARHGEPDMHLPAGKTCADCRHFERCSAIYGHVALDEVCDWAPSRFVQRLVVSTPEPDWTAEEEEQFRALERQQAARSTAS